MHMCLFVLLFIYKESYLYISIWSPSKTSLRDCIITLKRWHTNSYFRYRYLMLPYLKDILIMTILVGDFSCLGIWDHHKDYQRKWRHTVPFCLLYVSLSSNVYEAGFGFWGRLESTFWPPSPKLLFSLLAKVVLSPTRYESSPQTSL